MVKPLPSLEQAQWQRYYEQLNSPVVDKRYQAVTQLMRQKKDEDAINLLRQRITREQNNKVIELLLKFFEESRSRKDFFFLRDFLKTAPDLATAVKTISIMHQIHAPRLRYELEQLFENRHHRILSLSYMQAIQQPDNRSIIWMQKSYLKFQLDDYFLELNKKVDVPLFEAASPYFSQTFLKNEIKTQSSAARWYWYLAFSKAYSFSMVDKQPADNQAVFKLPPHRINTYLNLIQQFKPSILNKAFFANFHSSPEAMAWLVHYHYQTRNIPGILAEQLKKSNFTRTWVIMAQYKTRWSDQVQQLAGRKCEDSHLKIALCFRLKKETQQAAFFNNASETDKDKIVQTNLERLVQIAGTDSRLLRWLLTHHDTRIRLRAAWFLNNRQIKENKLLIAALIETDRFTLFRNVLISRIVADDQLFDTYRDFVEQLAFYRSKSIDTEAGRAQPATDSGENSNPANENSTTEENHTITEPP